MIVALVHSAQNAALLTSCIHTCSSSWSTQLKHTATQVESNLTCCLAWWPAWPFRPSFVSWVFMFQLLEPVFQRFQRLVGKRRHYFMYLYLSKHSKKFQNQGPHPLFDGPLQMVQLPHSVIPRGSQIQLWPLTFVLEKNGTACQANFKPFLSLVVFEDPSWWILLVSEPSWNHWAIDSNRHGAACHSLKNLALPASLCHPWNHLEKI